MIDLIGEELDAEVARVLGETQIAPYSRDWNFGGPLIHRFRLTLSSPDSQVHVFGGPKAGWGPSERWTSTSWVIKKADGHRALGFHETEPLVAAMRVIAQCVLKEEG